MSPEPLRATVARTRGVGRGLRSAGIIAARDFTGTFGVPFGYGLAAGFLLLTGVLLALALHAGQARLDGWFAPLYVITGILASLLAMRAFADEERTGSLELLLTAPVQTWQVVVGKLLGAFLVYVTVVAGTIAAPLLVAHLGNPDLGPIITGYVGLLLIGLAFLSVGLAASAATSSQLVASVVSAGVLLGLWFGAGLADGFSGRTRFFLAYFSPSTHVTGFLRGTISAADVTFFVSLTVLAFALAVAIVRGRR